MSITNNDVIYIADSLNHRVLMISSYVILTASVSITNSISDHFNDTHDVMTTSKSLYVLDRGNHRVQELSLRGLNPITVLKYSMSYTVYYFYVDDGANIYLSATEQHKVLLFCSGSKNSTVVAGSGVAGSENNQLNKPFGMFVNRDGTIYIADNRNHRIMKWLMGATSGTLVAGSGTSGNDATQLNGPRNIIVDTNEYMYIVDGDNHRIVRWIPGASSGTCIAACTGAAGNQPTQLMGPRSIAFDSTGSLYVTDRDNHRVQQFSIRRNSSE